MKKSLLVVFLVLMASAIFSASVPVYVYGSGPKVISTSAFTMVGYSVVTQTAGSTSYFTFSNVTAASQSAASVKAITSTAAVGSYPTGLGQYGMGGRGTGYTFTSGLVVDFGTNTVGAFFY